MIDKPELLSVSPGGATIHRYQLTGGKTVFTRFLGCYLGVCKFCGSLEEATDYLTTLEIPHS